MRNTIVSIIGMAISAAVGTAAMGGLTPQQAISSAVTKDESGTRPSKSGRTVEPTAVRPAENPTAINLSEYRIGEQDVLMITVWKEPELSGPVMVRPDGKITVPLINEVSVTGMTPEQLQAALTEKFHPFLTVPKVTVTVREINSRKVYVIGQVGKEGAYPINSTTTVLQIIAQAGGLRDFANRKKIYVLRIQGGKQARFPFNYEEVIRGKNYNQNVLLLPGDTVVVP